MNQHISGKFDVKITPQAAEAQVGDAKIGRMALDKQFHGGLEAASKGQMLAFMTDTPGSAGYVALERVVGTLQGRSGSFALQHSGLMDRGAKQLSVTVVPDSGTEALQGLLGKMTINIEAGEHFYAFDYSLPDAT